MSDIMPILSLSEEQRSKVKNGYPYKQILALLIDNGWKVQEFAFEKSGESSDSAIEVNGISLEGVTDIILTKDSSRRIEIKINNGKILFKDATKILKIINEDKCVVSV